MANNLRIVSDNLTLSSTITLTSGSTAAGFSLDSLKTFKKGSVWRSVGTTATVQVAFSSDKTVGCVAMPFCNLSKTATMTVQLYNSGGTLVATYTSNPCAPFAQLSTAQWQNLPSGVNSYAYGGGTCARAWFTKTACRSVRVTISDSSNPQGYLELSNLIVGDYWEPTYNTSFGLVVGYEDSSKQQRTEAGSLITDIGTIAKKFTFELKYLTTDDRNKLLEIVRYNSVRYPVFVSAFPLDTDMEREGLYQIYGKFTSNPLINHPMFSIYATSIDITEI